MKPEILIATNGFQGTWTAIEYGAWLAGLMQSNVTLLGVNNKTETPGVRIHRAANGGWGIGNFVQRDWTFDQ